MLIYAANTTIVLDSIVYYKNSVSASNKIDCLSPGTIICQGNLSNGHTSYLSDEITFVSALYSGTPPCGKLVDIKVSNTSISMWSTVSLDNTVTIPATGQYYIKSFVWNSLTGSIIPYFGANTIAMQPMTSTPTPTHLPPPTPTLPPIPQTASSINDYITGNATVGQTLTAKYTYYDPNGNPQTDVSYQWMCSRYPDANYKNCTGEGSTSSSYTLTPAGQGYYIRCRITTSNGGGAGMPVYSRIYGSVVPAGTTTTPAAKSVGIASANGTYMPGDTLTGYYTYYQNNGDAEGVSTYQWSTSDTYAGTYVNIPGATASTYKLTSNDYGKFIKFTVTPKNSAGISGSSVSAVLRTGNLMVYDHSPSVSANSGFNSNNTVVSGAERLWDGNTATAYTSWANTSGDTLILDVGRHVKFDGIIAVCSGFTDGMVNMYYSNDDANPVNWTQFVKNGSPSSLDYSVGSITTARFFKFVGNSSGNGQVQEFYPYMTLANTAEIIGINLSGASVDYVNRVINNVSQDTTAAELYSSLTIPSGGTVQVQNVDGTNISSSTSPLPVGSKVVVTSPSGNNSTTFAISFTPPTITSISLSGAMFDNNAKIISNIAQGITSQQLLDSISVTAGAQKQMLDASGQPVYNLSDTLGWGYQLKLTSANGSVTNIYTISFRLPASGQKSHPIQGNMQLMFTSAERNRINNEDLTALHGYVDSYMNMSEQDFITYVQEQAMQMVSINTRLSIETLAQRLSKLYVLLNDEAYAKRAAIIMYCLAKQYVNVPKTVPTSSLDYTNGIPALCSYAYDLIYNSAMWTTLSAQYRDDVRGVVEGWFRSTLSDVYALNESGGTWLWNQTPYTIKNALGTAIILNDPEQVRNYIRWMDKLLSGFHFHADGMWEEGTVDYHTQTAGNLQEAISLLSSCWSDPPGYVDNIMKLSLDHTDITSRYPMLSKINQIQSIMRYPDGSKIAIHDTHPNDPAAKKASDPIQSNLLNNIELNNFGYFGLTMGDTSDALQAALEFPPYANGDPYSGGHYHGNQLGITLWGGGMEVLPDAGYPWNRNSNGMFHTDVISHNSIWIWDQNAAQNYSLHAGESTRPSLLAYDPGTSAENNKQIQLIEAQQPGPPSDNVTTKRRMLIMIKISGNRGYVVDISRLKGGQAHEQFLRASEEEDNTLSTSLSLTPHDGITMDSYLQSIGKTQGLGSYRNLLNNPQTASGTEDFNFTWTGNISRNINGYSSGTSLRAFLNGVPNSEVFFSRMPTLRWTYDQTALQNNYPGWHFYRRRLVTPSDTTVFGSVYETWRSSQSPLVQSVQWLDATPSDGMCKAVIVTTADYIDTLYISNDTALRTVNGINFAGNIAVLRKNKTTSAVVFGYIYGQGGISCGTFSLTGVTDTTLRITNAQGSIDNSVANTLTLDGALPSGVNYNNIWISTRLGDSSGFGLKIASVQTNGGKSTIITVQPPPFKLTDSGAKMLYVQAVNGDDYTQPRIIKGNVYAEVKVPTFVAGP